MLARVTFPMIPRAIAGHARHALLIARGLKKFDCQAGPPFEFGSVRTLKTALIATSREPESALARRLCNDGLDHRFWETLLVLV